MRLATLFLLALPAFAQYTLGDVGRVHISPTHGIIVAADGMYKCWTDGTHCQLSSGLTNGNPLKATIAVSAMVLDSSNNLWVGSDGGGVYKLPAGSTNSYTNWVRPQSGLDRLVVKQISLNSSNEPVVASRLGHNFRYRTATNDWVATTSTTAHNVNGFFLNSSNNILAVKQQNGIDISTDGGTVWTALRGSIDGLVFATFKDASGRLYVGTEDEGFHRSTDDGVTFSQIGPNVGNPLFVLHNAAGLAVAGNGNLVGVSSSGQTVAMAWSPSEFNTPPTTPTDSPSTWTATVCSACTYQGLTRRVVSTPNNGDIYASDGYYGGLRSVNNGVNSAPLNTGISAWARNMQGIAYNPGDTKLYLGSETAGIWRTQGAVNGASNPSVNFEQMDGPYFGQFQSIVEDRGVLLASTSGNGVSRSVDGGRNWIAANSGLTNLFSLRLAIHPITKEIWASTQSYPRHTPQDARDYSGGGAWKTADLGVTWSAVSLTGLTASTGPNQVCFMSNGDAYGYVKNDAVYKLPNGGSTWSALTAIPSSNIRTAVEILCDGVGNIFVVTGIGFSYVSTDSGVSWTVLSPNGTFPVHAYINPANNDVYMLHATGAQKSTDHGATFAAVASLPSRRYSSMMISGSLHVYGGEDGQYGIGAIVVSTNSGSTYSTVSVTQTDNPGTVTLDPLTSGRTNGQSAALVSAYLGEDPNQTYSISGGNLNVTGATGTCTNDCGIYWQMLPQGTSGYNWTAPCDSSTANCGYLQHWVTTTPWDAKMNRLTMDATCTTTITGKGNGQENVQLGTYVRDRSSVDGANQGQHYYHVTDADFPAGKKVSFTYNAHPQHRVGASSGGYNWPNDPELAAGNLTYSYFDSLTRIYWDTQGTGWDGKTCAFSNLKISRVENEPDEYVSGFTITHDGSSYKSIWQGAKNDVSTFTVYRSTASMHLNGLSSGTLVGTAAYAAGGNDYAGVYQNFTLAAASTMYVAVRPNVNILTATNATPIVIGMKADPMWKDGDAVSIAGAAGNTAANGTRYVKLVAASLGASSERTGSTYQLYSDAALTTAVAGNGTYTASSAKATATNDFTGFTEVIYTATAAPPVTTGGSVAGGKLTIGGKVVVH